jgi:hypothetical protein
MKILAPLFFLLKFVLASLEPITYYNDYYDSFPHDDDYWPLFSRQFCEASSKVLSLTFPPKLIKHFYNLDEDHLPFLLFFWANILTIPYECLIYWGENGQSSVRFDRVIWRKAIRSLISYTKENLLILKEPNKKLFLNSVLSFYHAKLRIKFKKSQKDWKKFDKIDRKFHQMVVSLETRRYEYNPPADIHLALCYVHREICQSNKRENEVKFFYLIRYFRVTTSEYSLLNWLINQPVEFIHDFLVYNICFTINPDLAIRIPIVRSVLNTYYISLRRIVPIFDLDFNTKMVKITLKKTEVYDRLPCLREIDLFDLTRLLNRFFQKLSK